MAFNTKEILNWELSDYRFKPEGNAERLRLNALHRKNARIYAKNMREQEEREKYEKDREKTRRIHENLRKKKQAQLAEIGE